MYPTLLALWASYPAPRSIYSVPRSIEFGWRPSCSAGWWTSPLLLPVAAAFAVVVVIWCLTKLCESSFWVCTILLYLLSCHTIIKVKVLLRTTTILVIPRINQTYIAGYSVFKLDQNFIDGWPDTHPDSYCTPSSASGIVQSAYLFCWSRLGTVRNRVWTFVRNLGFCVWFKFWLAAMQTNVVMLLLLKLKADTLLKIRKLFVIHSVYSCFCFYFFC